MLGRFHAFGHRFELEGAGQLDDAFDDAQVVRVGQHVAHKALVDLERLHGQLAQVGERGIAGAEVVQRKADSQLPALAHHLDGLLHVGNGGAFQDFQLDQVRRQVRVAGQHLGHLGVEAAVQQLVGADVDAHAQVQSLAEPARRLGHGLANDPVAQRPLQVAARHEGQELARRAQALARVVPAQQGLGTHQPAAAQLHLGLVVQQEFTLLQRLAQPAQLQAARMGLAVVFRIEQLVAVAPGLLGHAHGLVGMAQQQVGVGLVVGVEADAQAGGHGQHPVLHGHGTAGRLQHPVEDGGAVLGRADVRQ